MLSKNSPSRKFDNAINVPEMKRLRLEENLSLQKIGDIYGISRQRVQQLIGATGFYSATVKNASIERVVTENRNKTNQELAEMLGTTKLKISRYRSGTRHALEHGSYCEQGALAEEFIAQELTSRGIKCELQPHNAPFDILVGKNRINVKSTSLPNRSKSQKNKNNKWQFSLGGRDNCDYFIFMIIPTYDIFIVPSSVTPDRPHIAFCFPAHHNSKMKWQKYHNRFDLLMDKNVTEMSQVSNVH